MTREEYQQLCNDLAKQLIKDGRLVEAGWQGLRKMWLTPDAPPDLVEHCRWAFMAGAQHLFGSIMQVMDEDREPTPADMLRMDSIDKELRRFRDEIVAGLETKGPVQ